MEEARYKSVAACSQFDGELEAYIEGETRPFIASHAQECSACGTLLADLQSITRAAHDLALEEPSPAVWSSLHARLQAEGAFVPPACRQFDAELETYLEGEARPLVVAHARECASCGALLADLQSIKQTARELPQEEPSPAVWATLRASLKAEGAFTAPACTQFEAELAAYLEGESRPFVLAHAQECKPCGVLLSDLQSIQQAARNLALEEPSRVVWANVHAQLEAQGAFGTPVTGWRQILAWRFLSHPLPLAALAALVIMGAFLTLPSGSVQPWGNGSEVAESRSGAQMASMAPAGEDSNLANVVSNLESNYRANEASMAPDLKATYEKSLVSLDGSIKECLDSLQQEPRNSLARDYLLTAYSRKAEVLSSALESEGR